MVRIIPALKTDKEVRNIFMGMGDDALVKFGHHIIENYARLDAGHASRILYQIHDAKIRKLAGK